MNLIWKRPDGYHGALPADFTVVKVGDHSNLWVHRTDRDTFPFRVSGGWEEEAQTKRLNNFITLLNHADDEWLRMMSRGLDNTMHEQPREYCQELYRWLEELKAVIKGGNWEVEIINKALDAVRDRLQKVEADFVASFKDS